MTILNLRFKQGDNKYGVFAAVMQVFDAAIADGRIKEPRMSMGHIEKGGLFRENEYYIRLIVPNSIAVSVASDIGKLAGEAAIAVESTVHPNSDLQWKVRKVLKDPWC